MPTLELLRRKIETATDLQSVVTTMKTLAAVSIHQYERAADALAAYHRTIEMGLQIVLRDGAWRRLPACDRQNVPAGSSRYGVIVFGSDQGMCGQFNEQIARYAIDRHAASSDRRPSATCVIGSRVVSSLTDAGWTIDESFRIPTSVPEIADGVSNWLLAIERLRETRQLTTLRVFSNIRSAARSYQSHSRQLLPINPKWLSDLRHREWDSRSLPTFAGDRQQLMALLIRQSLYVSLYQACAESLASENASRIAAMQAAEKNIEETLDELDLSFKTQRQTAITEEILDVVIGFEALMSQQ